MAGEVYSFSTAFYNEFVMNHDLDSLYRHTVPVMMFTDSNQMFDVIMRA